MTGSAVQSSFKILSEEGYDHIIVYRQEIVEGVSAQVAIDQLFDAMKYAEEQATERKYTPFGYQNRRQQPQNQPSNGSSSGPAPSGGVPTTYKKDGRVWEKCGAGIVEWIKVEESRIGFKMTNRRHEVYANRPMTDITPLFADGVLGDVLKLELLGPDNEDKIFRLAKEHYGLMVAYSGRSTDREHWDVIKIRVGTEEDKLKYS